MLAYGGLVSDLLHLLLEARSTVLADVAKEPQERLLVRCDRSGTFQLHELNPISGCLRQLTDLPDPVAAAGYVPGRRVAVLEVDRDGDERHQLLLLDLDTAPDGGIRDRQRLRALTVEPDFGHHLAGIAPDGSAVAFTSNRRDGVDFDLWLRDLDGGDERCLYRGGGQCQPGSGFSPDGRWVSVLRPGPRPLDTELLLVDVATGEVRPVLAHPDEAAQLGPPAWTGRARAWVSANTGRDTAAVVEVDVAGGAPPATVAADESADLDVVAAAGGQVAAVVANSDGVSDVVVVDPATGGSAGSAVAFPEAGVVAVDRSSGPLFSADGRRLYLSLSTPRQPAEVWVVDCADATAPSWAGRRLTGRRLTVSSADLPTAALATAETHRVASFDGEQVPVALYRPRRPAPGPLPAVLVIHGGPESQATRSWNPVVQGLAAAGYAVVVPNVRGSTGYGKRYASLDDTTRRLDSVADLAAVHDWLPVVGLDPARAALWGGSYGGYMVLAGAAFQPERWAAGVDIVGISDLVTFLENTSAYRRTHREREYGSLAADRDFLAAASPLRSAERIRAPLFVIHGRNDPRVPLSEAEQLVAGLRARGVRCELSVYDDEGHGLARLANRLDAYPRAVAFLDSVLRTGR